GEWNWKDTSVPALSPVVQAVSVRAVSTAVTAVAVLRRALDMGKLLSPGRREERQTIWISRAARSPGRVLRVDRYAVGVVSTATSPCACQGVTHSAGTSSFRFPGGRRCGSETPTRRGCRRSGRRPRFHVGA